MDNLEGYTEEDKKMYDDIYKEKIEGFIGNPSVYDIILIKMSCRRLLCIKKGDKWEQTEWEKAEIKRIWEEYGQYNI